MDHFIYQDGELNCEGVPVSRVAEAVGTPAYVYSSATLSHHFDAVAKAFARLRPIICYSIKSCPNVHICRLLRERGAGFDVVSGGELARAIAAGADPATIVYAGVGKTDAEIAQALDARIGWFNIESEAELENLIAICRRRGQSTRAALRVNPDVDPKTHRYTSTGKKETKFGVDLERARRVFAEHRSTTAALGCEPVRLTGIHLHIGSPVNSVEPYVSAIRKTLGLIDELRSDGFAIDMLDIGGGFGAHYKGSEAPPAVQYAEAIVPLLADRVEGKAGALRSPTEGKAGALRSPTEGPQGLQIIMEPGRSIAANAGILLTRVLYLKSSGERDFLIVDAGMNDLIRPALYEAYHFIWPAKPGEGFVPEQRGEAAAMPGCREMDVVGPVCESGDFLAKERMLPPMNRGDLVAVFTAGAYGMSMASHYNSRPNPAEVLVEGDRFRVIRRREAYEELIRPETT